MIKIKKKSRNTLLTDIDQAITSKIILVTGGAGFIGSALVRYLLATTHHIIINVDKLTYAGINIEEHPRHIFIQKDICDAKAMHEIFSLYQPNIVMHLAAETHVDRSIDNPFVFIQTNVVGTFVLLEEARTYWTNLSEEKKSHFRFHHISTDEVFGDLECSEVDVEKRALFTEQSPYAPSSPYSASKASSDHLVRAWHRTYGLPVVISNTSNNYGPYQYPEKFIPRMILNALSRQPLPIYGDGHQSRDWLYVDDHANALWMVAERGKIGETYNIGAHSERKNIEVVYTICDILDEEMPRQSHRDLIRYITDRPGHDRRYAIDASKIQQELGWKPQESFASGLRKTVLWYLEHHDLYRRVMEPIG